MRSNRIFRIAVWLSLSIVTAIGLGLFNALPAQAIFAECPPIGADTGCRLLETLTGGFPHFAIPQLDLSQPPLDGADDTLVGFLNDSGAPVSSTAYPTEFTQGPPIFSFDGDEPHATDVSFSSILPDFSLGDINFSSPLTEGTSTWASFECVVTGFNSVFGESWDCSHPDSVPEPSAALLFATAFISLVAIGRFSAR
jgi:hypothetical protein